MNPIASKNGCNAKGNSPCPGTLLVLGIGNVLWADEGFGVRCVEALQRSHVFAPHVQLLDGGTQGLYLLEHVQTAMQLLIFDAIDYGLEPGTLKVIDGDEVPRFMGAKKMSLHQTGFQEVLMVALLTGRYPEKIRLIGCQPEELDDYGGSLREPVRRAMPVAVEIGLATLRDWGGAPEERNDAEPVEPLTGSLALEHYEGQRPPESVACRIGDERFLPQHPEG